MTNDEVVSELLYMALESEQCGVRICETALRFVGDGTLQADWDRLFVQTLGHLEVAIDAIESMGLDLAATTPGRDKVRAIGSTLVAAMERALSACDSHAVLVVAAECLELAVDRERRNAELLAAVAARRTGDETSIRDACIADAQPSPSPAGAGVLASNAAFA